MENTINTLRIQNFKSIKDVTMKPRRVNLIIGQPNVGKSNILEAMSLLSGYYNVRGKKFMKDFMRYEKVNQLFYNNVAANTIKVIADDSKAMLGVAHEGDFNYLIVNNVAQDEFFEQADFPPVFSSEHAENVLLANFFEVYRRPQFHFSEKAAFAYSEVSELGAYTVVGSPQSVIISQTPYQGWRVKPYAFTKTGFINHQYGHTFLQPPYGDNLIDVIRDNAVLRREINNLFDPYGQKMLLRTLSKGEQELEVIRDFGGVTVSNPYSSIADTLQRIIFYLASIESNDDSVLLFEEPEAHTFPVYTTMLGQRIAESRNNQFFVATHSPYLLTEIIENLVPQERGQELAIFLAYYEDYQTKIYQLTDEEVGEIRRDAIDVFYNLSRYTPHANPYA